MTGAETEHPTQSPAGGGSLVRTPLTGDGLAAAPASQGAAGLGEPARTMTDLDIAFEIVRLGDLWDGYRRDLEQSGGHGGSPGEWIMERLDELETEQKRRGIIAP